jgi:hypothetical protein
MDRMRAALKRFAASVGKPQKYSDPMTWFWMQEVAAARATLAAGADFDGMLAANPQLRDKTRYQG